MKLTKEKLKQLIREELGGESTVSLSILSDALETALPAIKRAYDSLPDNRSKAEFEEYLLKNITLQVDNWREERKRSEPTTAPTSSEPQQFHDWGTSTGPWEE